ncbi:MAG: nitroreductase family deazaflavin-dependent oxidoreductase [Chloroflexota bacterium]|nr:nitroreductase family deazaflavin-dependent oxidoreductase [Chloroflexota bacterium]
MAEKFEMKGWFRLANRMMTGMVKLGFTPNHTVLLTVPGRKSGVPRTNPVSVIEVNGERYIQSPYGNVDWVRNVRAAGQAIIQVGRRKDPVRMQELTSQEAVPVVREVLRVAPKFLRNFYDASSDASPAELELEAAKHPVFRVLPLSMVAEAS